MIPRSDGTDKLTEGADGGPRAPDYPADVEVSHMELEQHSGTGAIESGDRHFPWTADKRTDGLSQPNPERHRRRQWCVRQNSQTSPIHVTRVSSKSARWSASPEALTAR